MKRQSNIELLRCLAMLGVVFLHCSNYPYHNYPRGHLIDDSLITIFHSICWVSVNVLVLITGYFTITSESGRYFKFRKMTKMYLQMWFYALIFFIIAKYTLGQESSLTPLKSGTWWYMTEYFKLMLFAPFIVRAVQMMNKRQYMVLTALFVLLFAVIHFQSDGGFGFLWFVTLFLVGGGIKMYHPLKSLSLRCVILIYSTSLFLFLINRWMRSFYSFNVFTITYDNIFVLAMAICLLELFSRVTINNKFFTKVITFVAPCTLGVYLIHTHPVVQEYIWAKFAGIFPDRHFIVILLGTIVVYCICVILDFIRQLVFKIFNFDFAVNKSFDAIKIYMKNEEK